MVRGSTEEFDVVTLTILVRFYLPLPLKKHLPLNEMTKTKEYKEWKKLADHYSSVTNDYSHKPQNFCRKWNEQLSESNEECRDIEKAIQKKLHGQYYLQFDSAEMIEEQILLYQDQLRIFCLERSTNNDNQKLEAGTVEETGLRLWPSNEVSYMYSIVSSLIIFAHSFCFVFLLQHLPRWAKQIRELGKDACIDPHELFSPYSMGNSVDEIFVEGSVSLGLKLKDFEHGSFLASGAFGEVYLARHQKTKFVVALKILPKEIHNTDESKIDLINEIKTQTSLRHPNILQMYGYFHDKINVYLIMEYAPGGSLCRGICSSKTAAKYAQDMSLALEYMHSKNIAHRDLKPDNVLLGYNKTIKIADFGFAVVIPPGSNRKSDVGSLDYQSPEMVCYEPYNSMSDNWALGVILFEILAGKRPFNDKDDEKLRELIIEGHIKWPNDDMIPAEAKDLVEKLLTRDPIRRLSMKDVRMHPFVLNNCFKI
jgi:aurora kinase